MRFVELGERGRGVAGDDRVEHAADAATVGKPEHVAHFGGGDPAAAMGDRLIEDRQAVAGRTFGGAGDGGERVGFDRDTFKLGDMGEVGGEQVGGDSAQVEALAARQHRYRDLVHFGRGEQEFDVRGGSSSVFSKALKAFFDSMWTSSMM